MAVDQASFVGFGKIDCIVVVVVAAVVVVTDTRYFAGVVAVETGLFDGKGEEVEPNYFETCPLVVD